MHACMHGHKDGLFCYYICIYHMYQSELSMDSPNPGVSMTVSFILTPLGSSKGSMSAVTVSMVVVGLMLCIPAKGEREKIYRK